MYNLLVQPTTWEASSGSITIERNHFYSYSTLDRDFNKSWSLSPDYDRLIKLPCLFVKKFEKYPRPSVLTSTLFDKANTIERRKRAESEWHHPARVGSINSAKKISKQLDITYAVDTEIVDLTSGIVQLNREYFGINERELWDNYWAVKHVDLYRSVLHLLRSRRRSPTIFSVSAIEQIDSQQISVMMPFERRFDRVFSTLRKTSNQLGLRCNRADDFWENHEIMRDIVSLIDRSRIVICDCTGRNPNVFYETGIAHTLGRDVILITQDKNDVPFDLGHLRFITYLSNPQGLQGLANAVAQRIQALTREDP